RVTADASALEQSESRQESADIAYSTIIALSIVARRNGSYSESQVPVIRSSLSITTPSMFFNARFLTSSDGITVLHNCSVARSLCKTAYVIARSGRRFNLSISEIT